MSIEERDQAHQALITCDGVGKERKEALLLRLIKWHRKDAAYWACGRPAGPESANSLRDVAPPAN